MPASNNDDNSNYKVGYGKPPVATRFTPGRSGNPNGRPKGTRNLKTDLAEELQEKVAINEGGEKRTISKQQALVKSLMAKALGGDVRAANIILMQIERLLNIEPDRSAGPLTANDDDVLEDFLRRHTPDQAASSDGPDSSNRGSGASNSEESK